MIRPVALRLDHASIAVPELTAAVERLDRRSGLRATVSPEAPDRHSRVYLDRSYLEGSAGATGGNWEATMFFLNVEDPEGLRLQLDDAGVVYRSGEYEGVDGTWDEVAIGDAAALPTIIRRTAPRAVARDWPPALARAHRSGARTLAAVHVEVPSLEEAVEAYRRLTGPGPVSTLVGERQPSSGRASVRLASGEIVLHQGRSVRIRALVLGVTSLAATRTTLGEGLGRTDEGVAWLDPVETHGLRLGFTELPPLPKDAER